MKNNQDTLLEAVEEIFTEADIETLNSDQFHFHQTVNNGHGRSEFRSYYTIGTCDLPMASQWRGLKNNRDSGLGTERER